MGKYLARRLLIALPVLFAISVIDFAFISLAPGDPLQAMLPPEALGNTEGLDRLYERTGLRDSVPVRYVRWIGELTQGNFGTSFRTGQPVATMIGDVLPATLLLTMTAMALGLAAGIPLGIVSALRERSLIDEIATLFSFVATAIPGFFLAIIAVFLFAITLGWFPATGMRRFDQQGDLFDLLHHLALPAIVLGLLSTPVYARYTRAAVLDVTGEDYVRTARAKGLQEGRVTRRHILPNALMPLVTVVGLSLPGLVGSSVLVEQVFAWPGMGQLSINSALFRDYPVFMATALIYALAVVISSMLTDVAYALINPRIRYD